MVARSTRSFEPTTPAPVHSARPDRRSFAALIRQDPLSTAVTIGIDVVSATVALALVIWWTVAVGAQLPPTWMLALFVPATIAVMATRGIYRRRLNRRFIHEVGPVVATVALASMVLLSGLILAHVPENPEQFVLRAWICATAMILTGRLIRATVQRRLRLRRHLLSPTLIVGNGIVAHQIIERLLAAPEHGLDPIGLLDTDSPWHPDHNEPVAGVRRIGAPETIEQAILDTGAEAIVIAFSRTQDELLARVVRLAHATGSRVWVVPRMFDVIGERSTVEHVGGLPLLSLPRTDPRGWQFTVKHVFDQVCGTVGLVLISPLFLTLMALVRLSSPARSSSASPELDVTGGSSTA